jgi:polyisoprenoid-binding protein YceI
MKQFLAFTVLLVAAASTLSAQTWKLDKSHSNVLFSVRHLVVSEVVGKFKEFDVNLSASKEDFSDARIDASVNVKSIDTEIADRDNHLKSDDFFNAEKFPQMTFKATSLKKVGGDRYQLVGDLTIRDITKEVTFDATLLGVIDAGKMGTRAGWKAQTTINRFDYNLQWNRALEAGGLVVGKDVTIMLNLEFIKA